MTADAGIDERHRTEVTERYRRRADVFEATVAAVDPADWSRQSPCAEWDARDVVRHIVEMQGVALRPHGRSVPATPSVDDDPLAAFRAARTAVEAVLADPELSARPTETPAGSMPGVDLVDRVASADLVLHRWDLARATGQDDTIDPDELAAMWPGLQEIPDVMRVPEAFGPGVVVFGPAVEVPEDAPLQDRALGLIGRDPAWTPPAR
ncbi:TIGR03086 family protein [Geodermatophilus sabuli]|uniref:TIGR03086 family protein n=1 Tax=Geodermatophilus sabuli TaxID=1564158 RepID=A0A7K3W4S4_9ACTN|nr:TIGR03086 family metal-binding protein [Geodermatophilus sabuli]NEK59670.1 TIGR03086 family protein [Geodermatophilus sabuli]